MQLFHLITKQKIKFIGISKDSRVSQFLQIVLLQLIEEEIDNLSIDMSQNQELKSSLSSERINPIRVFSTFERIAEQNSVDPYEDWVNLMDFIYLYLFPRNDLEIIRRYTDTAGFTTPILIKANDHLNRMKTTFFANPRDFIRSNFPLSISVVSPNQRAAFIKKITRFLARMDNFPSIISCVVKPTSQSYPMRVDILGKSGTFWGSPRFEFTRPPPTLDTVLGIVRKFFVDDRIHNAILWEVDKEVRITRKQVMNVYLTSLEQELGLSRSEFLARREIRHL